MKNLLALALITVLAGACDSSPPARPAAGPNAIEVTLKSEPPGASIIVDGMPLGPSPQVLKLTPGPHRAHASMSGYYPAPEARFQVGATEQREITMTLAPSH